MPGRRWIILAVLFAVRAATGFQFQSVGSAAKMLMLDLGIDYSEIGLLLGAYLLPGVIVAFPAGMLGRRFRDKTLGLVGLSLMVVSGAVMGASESLVVALVARIIGGVGATIVALVATKMTTDWFDSREIVLAMSILQVSWPFGAMLALPIEAHIAQLWGWPAVMISGAVCAAAALGAFAFVSQRSEQKQRTVMGRSSLPIAVLFPVIVAGAVWGAMNLTCVVLQLRAVVDGGAGIVAYRRCVERQRRAGGFGHGAIAPAVSTVRKACAIGPPSRPRCCTTQLRCARLTATAALPACWLPPPRARTSL